MNAEIIAAGSELLTPDRMDTNSLYLTGELNALGVEVVTKSVVGDHRGRMAELIAAALGRSDLVIVTGGLGPTEDDVTRDAAAQALGLQLSFHQDVAEAIRQRFARMKRQMSQVNQRQALVLDGAEVLPNGRGTAPGQWIETGGRIVILLPGPPREMQPMFGEQCVPRLKRRLPPLVIRTAELRIVGMPESDLDQLISPVYTEYANPVTTILAAPNDIQVHLRARSPTEEEAQALLAEVVARIEPLLGDRLYSQSGDPLEKVIGDMLRGRGATLSVAESCTGGALAERITSIAGSSDYFLGGFLTYTNRMKALLLGVPAALLEEHSAVSEQAAEAMAQGARERTKSTYSLSVTGVAGPGPATDAAPVGTVYIGLSNEQGASVRRFQFLGDRARVRAFAVQNALDILRRELLRAG